MSCPAQARIHRHTQYGGRVRNGDPVPTIACPLAGCSEQHELHHAKNKRATPYITCGAWGNSTVWFRSPASNEFLNANNGHAIENPIEPDDEPLPRTPRNPNFQPSRPAFPKEVAPDLARCGKCGEIIPFGISPCPR